MEDPTKGKSCSVCFSDFKKFRRAIICPFCDVMTCRDCVKDYLLGSSQDAHCMACKHQWNYAFMYNSFPETFLTGEYRKSRQKIALEREKALLPDTLPLVDEEKRKIEIQKEIEILNEKKNEHLVKMRKWKEKADDIQMEIITRKNNIKNVRSNIKRVQYIGPCPANDCRGFIEPKTHRCGLCEIYICRKCHEILGMGEENLKKLKKKHTCDENTVETVKDIKKMTKPCPKCQTPIFKIEGCFAPETPILLYSGKIVTASDVKIGMKLMGDDGTPRIVEELVSGEDEMFLITQTKADSYIVNSQHKLVLKYSGDRHISPVNGQWKVYWFDTKKLKPRSRTFLDREDAEEFVEVLGDPEIIEIPVYKYMEIKPSFQKSLLGYRSKGFEGKGKGGDIDPYILGLWLGDGYSNGSSFSIGDDEILEKIVQWGSTIGCEVTHPADYRFTIRKPGSGKLNVVGDNDCCKACSLIDPVILPYEEKNNWMVQLKKYNLVENKHIPLSYMHAKRKVRLSLLAGLIDSDGSLSNEGKRICIIQKEKAISFQIMELARSLGFVTHVSMRKKKNIKTPDGKIRDYEDQHNINISGNIACIPTIIPRKKCVSSSPNKDQLRTGVTVTCVGRGKYYGWKVSGLNKRFVLPDFTVVHNCDQMFCTQCRTPFSWNTGEIVTGVIHNPHYYEMMRNMGANVRNIGDVPCGGLPMHFQLNQFLQVMGEMNYFLNYEKTPDNVQVFMTLVHRRAGEIDAHITRRRGEVAAANNKAEQRRLDFLVGKIKTEKEFQAAIFRDERMKQKKEEETQILSTFLAGAIERMNDFIQTCTEETEKKGVLPKKFVEDKATVFMKDVKKMIRFCNKAFQDNYTAMNYKKFPQIVLTTEYTTARLFDKRIIVGKEPGSIKKKGRR